MADQLTDISYRQIIQCALVVKVCVLTRHRGQVICILLGSHIGQLQLPRNDLVLFCDSLIGCVLPDKIVFCFNVQTQ